MNRLSACACVAAVVIANASLPINSSAGLGDSIKKKAQDKANKEANKTADDAVNKTTDTTKDAKPGETTSTEPASKEAPAGDATKVSAVSTKFDYVPGDKVLFYDDFTQDELGEFPANWKLEQGTLEVAEMEGRRWVRSTSITSRIAMKLPATPTLPEYWTFELDFYCGEPSGNVLDVIGVKGNQNVWDLTFPYSNERAYFLTGNTTSDTPLENAKVWGAVHHVMFMARGNAVKAYIDQQRVANIPEINLTNGAPDYLVVSLWSDKEPMITNVRFAEGNKPAADPFANGKFVTYGIYFDSGSDVVKAESAPVLRQLAAFMEKNAAVKVEIDGHTDNEGTPAGNLDLSKRRAASVAKVLSEQFKIAADRFKTDGMGDTKPVASNDKPEGRAMNRRVEFSKL
jgi:OOP family OmpA-OmpF porin